ncbi:DUF7446 family protein [Escherichia coli]|uniref:DUF7446 family protein n=1 Tax=Escherichia coli TaxID=562 RepID=UPI0014125683|nr:hypothetical protein [Escherichia coli]EFT6210887.1 hypothetical protein [Shigella flexneri]EFT6249089.1 hypothetical protein [Shigella flexneri]EFV8737230.1 hypothetical protein [Shigella flexneri]EGO7089798.1 hypothetical protein [Shigella flexneri]EHH0233836.1 hypothetical protein [Shigella flexneri]
MSNSARLQLGFSPLSKTIMLAKMRDVEGGRMRVGNDPGRDVTNEAAQLVWQLVMAEGGEIVWEAAEKRIAELELREVVLPQCYSMLHRVDFDEPYHTEMVYRQHQVLEALHNAGINVTEAGKGEAS